jgi:hypothetical protein
MFLDIIPILIEKVVVASFYANAVLTSQKKFPVPTVSPEISGDIPLLDYITSCLLRIGCRWFCVGITICWREFACGYWATHKQIFGRCRGKVLRPKTVKGGHALRISAFIVPIFQEGKNIRGVLGIDIVSEHFENFLSNQVIAISS